MKKRVIICLSIALVITGVFVALILTNKINVSKIFNKDNKVEIVYKYNGNHKKIIESIAINNKQIINKIKLHNDIEENFVDVKEKESFVIINIDSYTTEADFYNLYVFDYSGDILFEISDTYEDNFIYKGNYAYNDMTATIKFIKKRRCYDNAYIIPELGLDKETNMPVYSGDELAKLGKDIYSGITMETIYETSYLSNKKFSEPKIIKEIKLNEKMIKKLCD